MDTPTKITFRFIKDEGYRVLSVNRVWGGVTPHGEIQVELLHEAPAVPDAVTHALTPEGKLGEEVERTPGREIQRTVLVGMMLTAEHAESIGRWLQDRALEVRERETEQGEVDDERETPTAH